MSVGTVSEYMSMSDGPVTMSPSRPNSALIVCPRAAGVGVLSLIESSRSCPACACAELRLQPVVARLSAGAAGAAYQLKSLLPEPVTAT